MSKELIAPLSDEERETFALREEVIESGLKNFIEVGNALLEIRDARLYRDLYGNFETYCQERWSMSRVQAHRLIGAAGVSEVLPIGNRPDNEAQARPLAALKEDPKAVVEAWGIANEQSGGKPTAKHVEAAVEEVKARREQEAAPEQPEAKAEEKPKPYQPSNGIMYADNAISQLVKIKDNDTQRSRAFSRVEKWIAENK